MSTDITNLPPQDSMMASLERLARDPMIPTERITELFRLAEKRERTLLERAFHHDMNALQAELMQVQRDRKNPAFNSKYASYDQLDRAARPLYTKYGFDITFGTAPATREGYIMLTCTIGHRMGYSEQHSLEGPVSNEGARGGRMAATPIQAIGICTSYLKRYLLQLVLNLVTADDALDNDGNATVAPDPNAKYAEWLDRFEQAAGSLADSDAATELLNRDTVIRMLTEMPIPGGLRQRFMQLRADVERKWLQSTADAKAEAEAQAAHEPIEGL